MEKSLFGLEGKNFIVLGGGLGMGEATSKLLANLGANVAVLDIIPERAERVAAEINGGEGGGRNVGKAMPLVADVLDDDQLVAAIDRADKEFGPLDGMVTIVGMATMGMSIEAPMEAWDTDHRRNLRYIYLAAKELAKRLIARGAMGSIVSIASVDGLRASTNHAAYGAAKAGLVHLAASLAGEWSPYGVRFNVVCPGGIATPRIPAKSEEAERELMGLTPMKYRGSIHDVANALVFLSSDMAGYITGQAVAVDGGYTAVGPIDFNRYAKTKGVLDATKS
jgi:NAD(P)-dependent dehydrogenase (short-subunit alcohol dehydrogenase family)